MKSVISSTYDDKYLFFIPICVWLWNKLGVDVICFMPHCVLNEDKIKNKFVWRTIDRIMGMAAPVWFSAPKHKEATYAQCSRLYAACLDLPEDEILVTSDIDMALFKIPQNAGGHMAVFGNDLVPTEQIPICYLSGSVKEWRRVMKLQYSSLDIESYSQAVIKTKTYQECLDELLGHIEAEHFRGNYWGKDQETAYNHVLGGNNHAVLLPRARPGTQFASNRIDRDDAYFMDRLSPDIIDYHMHRPGYNDDNFEKILSVIKYFYPSENLDWMRGYQQQYKALL